MVPVLIGAAVVALFASTAILVAPKIPVYEFAVLYPPVIWFGDSWGELKATLHAKLSIMNENVIQSDIHAASFELFFPTWEGDFVQLGFVKDRFQDESNYTTPEEGFWKLKPKDHFETTDSVVLRIQLSNLVQILTHVIYRAVQGRGVLHVVSTGVTHISTPKNMKHTLTFVCDTLLNVITNKMVGSDCAVDKLSPGKWENMTLESRKMHEYAISLNPDPVNGTVLIKGKPQKKVTKALEAAES